MGSCCLAYSMESEAPVPAYWPLDKSRAFKSGNLPAHTALPFLFAVTFRKQVDWIKLAEKCQSYLIVGHNFRFLMGHNVLLKNCWDQTYHTFQQSHQSKSGEGLKFSDGCLLYGNGHLRLKYQEILVQPK